MTRWWRNAAMWRDKLAATKFAAHVRLHEGGMTNAPAVRVNLTVTSAFDILTFRTTGISTTACRASFRRGAMPNIVKEIAESASALAKGFATTFKEMLGPTITENYPIEPAHLEGRYRGVHVLRRDEDGLEKCVACFLCAAACPANCIYIEAAENTGEHRISAAERYAQVYNIDYNRCIFCGYCVEACPCDAITHGHDFEIAAYDTNTLVYRKEQLLQPLPAASAPTPKP